MYILYVYNMLYLVFILYVYNYILFQVTHLFLMVLVNYNNPVSNGTLFWVLP